MLTHSLIQYLTLPATPPSPVALAAGVRFIHKARLYEREIKDSLSPITRIVTVCAQRQDAQGNDSNLLIVFYVQIMPDDFVMQLHRF